MITGASEESSPVGESIAVGLSDVIVTASKTALYLVPGKMIGRSKYEELGVNIVGKG